MSLSKIGYSVLALAIITAVGCNSSSDSGEIPPGGQNPTTPLPATVEVGKNIDVDVDIASPDSLQAIELEVTIDSAYASISVLQGKQVLLDQVDIPSSGDHSLRLITRLNDTAAQSDSDVPFTIAVRTGSVRVKSMTAAPLVDVALPQFTDASQDVGLETEVSFKYGGPSIGDIEGNGFYDAILNNHNFIAPQVVTNTSGATVTVEPIFPYAQDYHGTALGDFTNDGNLDLMLAMGGANGTSPSSYILFKNDGKGGYVQVDNNGGINTPARGRAPRWVDLNNNGLLDLVLINATTPNYDGPIQLFYRNNGDGTFEQVRIPGIESTPSERVLIVDFDNDGQQDLLLFSPLSLWKNNGNFSFTNVTSERLPASAQNLYQVQAAAEVDLNNDGLFDIYLSRGLPEYQMSRKSYDYNPVTEKFDVRDDGEKGETLVDIMTEEGATLTLNELNLTYRQYDDGYPIYLGDAKEKKWVYATGFQDSQLHPDMKDAPHELDIKPKDAAGFPENRDQNGIYIGYTGNGKWKVEWVRTQDVYWNVSFSLENVTGVETDWAPTNRNVSDMLLINEGDKFVDATQEWNVPAGGNHWGVTFGDFNNSGWNDLFIHRYGFLTERVSDLLLVNNGKGQFETTTIHGAHDVTDPGHGDMGQAFDFNRNGQVDLLNGSNEEGKWYLYKNTTTSSNNYLNVDVGYSPFANIDPLGARIVLETASGTKPSHRVGSRGEAFSQGVMNLTHFGLGTSEQVDKATIIWRNGETVSFDKPALNGTLDSEDGMAPTPTGITLDREDKKLRVDETYELTPTFTPLNATPDVVYTSSNEAVASVNASGVITAKANGDAVITVTSSVASSVSQTIDISVGDFDPIYVTGIEIEHDGTPLYVGQEVTLDAALESSDPTEKPDDVSITWTTSDSAVATVTEMGVVSGTGVGEVTITATANGSETPDAVQDSITFDSEDFVGSSINFDNDWKYKTRANPINNPMEVTFKYHAGSNSVIPEGVKIYLRRLQSPSWGLVYDFAGQGTGNQYDVVPETVGSQSGTATYSLDLPSYQDNGLVPTKDLENGDFYYLYVEFLNDRGEKSDWGTQPVCITEAGDNNPC
ncbi:FG-GAP-like repeat-containing protein [Vibrio celticus]|uniref:Bacterial Ig-like domain (Group 2) n=1 Tax=Vibrio celticus TaxID=446372 RepID=A0A1C3JGC1_9VIBR|nr:FG-GAP-like repeat-containing protein [Vibrio celticus]SBT14161.1 Bacterial Ig-like domain (group 2) [Vibrio celticus]